MKNAIYENQSLSKMEKNIVSELDGKDLWGDIDISEEEYKHLKSRLRTLLSVDGVDIHYICKNYPCTLTSFMVFLARYQYNVNFWGLFSKELDIAISGPIESEVGNCARKTFRKYGFDFSDVEEERRKYLEPILYEAGRPPESSLDDLFFVLKYDTYSIFDPQLIIEDLVEMRSYQIRKPMLRFLKRFRDDRAVEFVLEVHDAMIAVDQNMKGESNYIDNYTEWKEKEKTKEVVSNHKKREFQTKPYLIFENGKRGLCLVLPRTILKDEWVEDVEWVIVADNSEAIRKSMMVFGDEGKRYIESIVLPVSPAQNYRVSLYDSEGVGEDLIIEWSIDGIRDHTVRLFNSNGRMITPSYLPVPYSIMVFPKDVHIAQCKEVTTVYQSYPTDRREYSIIAVEPNGRDASFSYIVNGSPVTLHTRPQIEMCFSGKTLFSLPEENGRSLYTDIPDLIINIEEGMLTNGFEIRVGHIKIDLSNYLESGSSILQLKKYKEDIFFQYGTYSLRLYQYDHFIKQIEFSYVPEISTDYSPALEWPSSDSRKVRKVFHFEKIADWELEFENCIVSNDEKSYRVECPTNIGSVDGILRSVAEDEGFSCHFELPISPFEIDILDSSGMILEESTDKYTKLGIDDFNDGQYWVGLECFGAYKSLQYKLKLRTSNGIEQEETFSLSNNGCGNFDLMAFHDTLNACPLPAKFELWCDEKNEHMPIIIIADAIELQKRPYYNNKGFIKASLEEGEKDLVVKRFGTEPFEMILPYSESRINKKRTCRGYICCEPLREGLYIVEGKKEKSDFIFEDDFEVELTNGRNTMYVSSRENGTPIESVSDWIDLLIKDVVKAGVNYDIQNNKSYSMLKDIAELEQNELDIYDYERLAALAYFTKAKCNNSKKNSIRRCMRAISKYVLNSKRRLELIRLLIDLNCPVDIFEICIQEYNLFLFERGSQDSRFLAEKLENISLEISILLMMGTKESVWDTIRREKYRDVIGKDAIRSLLSVPDEKEPSAIAIEQRKFLRESSPCKVRINLTKEISGDFDPLMAMLDITWSTIEFNISKKPDYGIYFDRIRYVDQYVNWYTASHDNKGNMIEWKAAIMKNVVQAECRSIIKSIDILRKDNVVGNMVGRYNTALRSRFYGDPYANMNTNSIPRYFYLQGLAAFLVMLPTKYQTHLDVSGTGERFMTDAILIAPKMARRDMLMASTFIYLVEKEEKICR